MNDDILLHIFSYLLSNVPFGRQYNILKSVSKDWYYLLREFVIKTTFILELTEEQYSWEKENIIYIQKEGNNKILVHKTISFNEYNFYDIPNVSGLIDSSQKHTIKLSNCVHNKVVLYDYDLELYNELELIKHIFLRKKYQNIDNYLKDLNFCYHCKDLFIPIIDNYFQLYKQTPNIIYHY
jgi:hypothetical protein